MGRQRLDLRKLNPKQDEKVARMYEVEGLTLSRISREMGVSITSVRSSLIRSSIRLRGNKRGKLPNQEVRRAVRMYQEGAGSEKVAVKFGVTASTVTRWVQEAGGTVRLKGYPQGEEHPGWRGGRIVRDEGYVMVKVSPDDPFYSMAQKKSGKARYALEHRLVMARHLGGPLERRETVHHLDGNRANNHIDNLQLRQGRHGKGVVLTCKDCGSHNIEASELSYN